GGALLGPVPLGPPDQSSYGDGASDAFLAKYVFWPSVNDWRCFYRTLLGGSGDDVAYGVVVGSGTRAAFVGSTTSENFPQVNAFGSRSTPGTDAFVALLDPNQGSQGLINSSYLGGSGEDFAYAITRDLLGNWYVTGKTTSTNFAGVAGGNGLSDVFLTKI